MSELHLLVPGLTSAPANGLGQQTPAKPLTARLLARADLESAPGSDYESALCGLLGIDVAEQDPPVAALRRAALGLPDDGRYWILVEPVCLRPDQSRLLLFDTLDFAVESDELASLGGAFKAHFQRNDWLIDIAESRHWYLAPDSELQLRSHSLGEVYGRNLDLFLPQGGEQLRWHALLNESQMLFHTHSVNQTRESAGRMPVNGVWFSGFGKLPAQIERRFGFISASDTLARGLAVLSGASLHEDRGAGSRKDRVDGDGVVVYPALQRAAWQADPFAWWQQLTLFERWLQPWLTQLKSGEWGSLYINGCDGRQFRLRRRHLYRFWRTPKSPSEWTQRG